VVVREGLLFGPAIQMLRRRHASRKGGGAGRGRGLGYPYIDARRDGRNKGWGDRPGLSG
jgi:hypothetical protein